jgi:agmatinase
MLYKSLVSLSLASVALAHGDHGHDQEPMSGPHQGLWYNTLPGDGGTQVSILTPIVANQADQV